MYRGPTVLVPGTREYEAPDGDQVRGGISGWAMGQRGSNNTTSAKGTSLAWTFKARSPVQAVAMVA